MPITVLALANAWVSSGAPRSPLFSSVRGVSGGALEKVLPQEQVRAAMGAGEESDQDQTWPHPL